LEELNPYTIGGSSENKAFIVKEVRLWKIVSKKWYSITGSDFH